MELHRLFQDIQSRLGESPPVNSPVNGRDFARWGKKKRYWALMNTDDKGVPYAIYGDWKTGERWYWSKAQGNMDKPTPQMKRMKEEADAEREKKSKASLDIMNQVFDKLKSCDTDTSSNPYAQKKNIPRHRMIRIAKDIEYNTIEFNNDSDMYLSDEKKKIPDDSLCVVLTNDEGNVCGIQYIDVDGRKFFLKGSMVKGARLVFGDERTASYFYIAEGIGTAAAVWNAVKDNKKSCVFCAFNCHNMITVAHMIRDKHAASKIIACQDNDDAGRDVCKKLEARLHDCVIKAPFQEGEDFADVTNRVAKKLLKINENDFIEIISIGMDSKRYVFYSTYKKEKTECNIRITKDHIEDIAPPEYWAKSFTGKEGKIDWTACSSYLKKISRKQGTIDETKLRGSGYFLTDPKNKRGHLYAQSEGVTYMPIDGSKLHLRGKKIHIPDMPTRPEVERCSELVKALVESCNGFCWTNKFFGKLLIGWLLSAPFCGCLPFRPHVWITGNSSSGKSWILTNVVKPLLGDNSYTITGDTTEAGIRAALKHDAVPTVIDEFESEDKIEAKKRQRTLELLRQTSSEIDATIFKGSPDGKVKTYKICTSALLASVRSALTFEANRNRFLTLSLDARKQRTQDFDKIVSGIKEKDLRFIKEVNINTMFFNFPQYHDFYSQWYNMLRGKLNEHLVRCYAVVCASLSFQGVPVEEESILSMARGELEASRSEEENCYYHLMSYELTHKGEKRGSAMELINELQDMSYDSKFTIRRDEIFGTLRSNGLNVSTEKWSLQIFYKHPKLCKIMSEYPDANWYKTLKNLKGARRMRTTLTGKGNVKGSCIEVMNFLQNYSEV